jgi:hypothetical protein
VVRKFTIDWRELSLKDLVELEVLLPYWHALPCRLIIILKDEYKKDLFEYVYDLLLKNNVEKFSIFANACCLIEMISGHVLNNERGLNDWHAKNYWFYLYRKSINTKNLFFQGKNKKNNKKWNREIARVLYTEKQQQDQ